MLPVTVTGSPGRTVAFRWTHRYASQARTGPSGCRATVRARGSPSALPGIAASRLATTRGSSWPVAALTRTQGSWRGQVSEAAATAVAESGGSGAECSESIWRNNVSDYATHRSSAPAGTQNHSHQDLQNGPQSGLFFLNSRPFRPCKIGREGAQRCVKRRYTILRVLTPSPSFIR